LGFAHSSEDEDISAQRDGGTDSDTADANFTQWSDSTHCPTAPVVHMFTEGPSGLRQTEAPHINKDFFLFSVFKLFFFDFITVGASDK